MPFKDLSKKYRMLDDKFFYWWKAQSPIRVQELFLKLKLCALAFALLSVTFVYIHSRSLHNAELEAIRQHENRLVEGRKLKKLELQKRRQVMAKPISSMYQ